MSPLKYLIVFFTGSISLPALAQWPVCEKDSLLVTFSALASNTFQVVADAEGGAYVTWYGGDPNQGQFRIHAQHMSRDGVRLWGDEGIVAAPESGNHSNTRCMPDGQGGLLVFWMEYRLGNGVPNLFGQRLNPAGQRLWGNGGRYLSDIFDFNRFPVLHLSEGSFAVAHNIEQSGGAYFSTYLRKLTPDGQFDSDFLLEEHHNSNYPVRLFDDDQGGVFAVWQNDSIKIHHIDEAGTPWPEAEVILPAGSGSVPQAYACNAGPEGVFICWCEPNPSSQLCDLRIQRFDKNGQPGLPPPAALLPVFGFYPEQVVAARNGGFYFTALNALHKVSPNGTLDWRTELPFDVNTGVFSWLIEHNDGSVLLAYSANSLVHLNPAGQVVWHRPGNTFNGGSFGLAGICRTADEAYFTAKVDPMSGASVLRAQKIDNQGHQIGTLSDFAGSIAGPDSVTFNTPFYLEAQPVKGVVKDWFYSFEPAQGFEKVPEEAFDTDKTFLGIGGIYYDLYAYNVVQLGRNCLDTTGLWVTHVRPVIPEGDFTKSDTPLVMRPTIVGMELFVASTFNQPYTVELWVNDVSGRVVDFFEFPVDAGNFYGLYPTDNFRQGVYFFTMKVRDKVTTQTFLKMTN